MKHIVFVTYELHPVNPGGAGVFIAGAVRELARAGYRCTVLCEFPEPEIDAANASLARDDLRPGSVRAVSVSSHTASWNVRADRSVFEDKSERFAEAVSALHARDPIDLVEFPEYAGMALGALRRRLVNRGLQDVRIAVRIHGSLEFIDQVEGHPVSQTRLHMHRMERLGLKLADVIFTPSRSMGRWYADYHGFDTARLIESPPPMRTLLKGFHRAERLVDPGHFLFYGKLQEVKGCDVLATAAASLLATRTDQHWRFTFVGRDMHCSTHGRPMSTCLLEVLPRWRRDAFEFIPAITREQLVELARTPIAAVVPSRFETFCLAAHELRAVGLPLLVPRIAGFVDYLNEDTGCLTYDGTANGLQQTMLRIREEPGLHERLASRPTCALRPYEEAYGVALDEPRPGDLPELELSLRFHELRALDALRAPPPPPPPPPTPPPPSFLRRVRSRLRLGST
ncbi:MAG TPA: glycosyltransferase family 4 protein [Archangium sp.]|nr:glycosyltransferase family 4 protein [Archangium sp.]